MAEQAAFLAQALRAALLADRPLSLRSLQQAVAVEERLVQTDWQVDQAVAEGINPQEFLLVGLVTHLAYLLRKEIMAAIVTQVRQIITPVVAVGLEVLGKTVAQIMAMVASLKHRQFQVLLFIMLVAAALAVEVVQQG